MAERFDPLELRDAKGEWTKEAKAAASKVRREAAKKVLLAHPIKPQNIVDTWNQANPDEKESGKDWYEDAGNIAHAFAAKFGVSRNQAAGIIATYSPQTQWGTNLVRAAHVLKTKKGVGGPGSGVMATTWQKDHANRILAGEDYHDVFTGPKVKNFAHLIENGGDAEGETPHVVVDRHADSVARGHALTEDEFGVDVPSSAKRYATFVKAYTDAAKIISKQEGHPVAPHMVQAATWLTRQRLNASAQTTRGRKTKARANHSWDGWQELSAQEFPGLSEAGAGIGSDLARAVIAGRTFDLAHPVGGSPQDSGIVTAIAKVLTAGSDPKKTVTALQRVLKPQHLTPPALSAALSLAGRGTAHVPNSRLGGVKPGSTTKTVRADEVYFRAAYLLNAAQRIQTSLNNKIPIRQALKQESTFYHQHEMARKQRLSVATKTQVASRAYGPLLGWYLNPLLNNDPECLLANGHNFYADEGTMIGLPGSVHPHCGCIAGPPIQGAGMVNDAVSGLVGGAKKVFKLKVA